MSEDMVNPSTTFPPTVHSNQFRSEYFKPRGLYAPESLRKRNFSNIARVIRALKGPYPGFRPSPPTKWDEFGERTHRTRSIIGETDPSEERRTP